MYVRWINDLQIVVGKWIHGPFRAPWRAQWFRNIKWGPLLQSKEFQCLFFVFFFFLLFNPQLISVSLERINQFLSLCIQWNSPNIQNTLNSCWVFCHLCWSVLGHAPLPVFLLPSLLRVPAHCTMALYMLKDLRSPIVKKLGWLYLHLHFPIFLMLFTN
jgi:hypothetical protein